MSSTGEECLNVNSRGPHRSEFSLDLFRNCATDGINTCSRNACDFEFMKNIVLIFFNIIVIVDIWDELYILPR